MPVPEVTVVDDPRRASRDELERDSQTLFSVPPSHASVQPGSARALSPISPRGEVPAALPRRRAPTATPSPFPHVTGDYEDDGATMIDAALPHAALPDTTEPVERFDPEDHDDDDDDDRETHIAEAPRAPARAPAAPARRVVARPPDRHPRVTHAPAVEVPRTRTPAASSPPPVTARPAAPAAPARAPARSIAPPAPPITARPPSPPSAPSLPAPPVTARPAAPVYAAPMPPSPVPAAPVYAAPVPTAPVHPAYGYPVAPAAAYAPYAGYAPPAPYAAPAPPPRAHAPSSYPVAARAPSPRVDPDRAYYIGASEDYLQTVRVDPLPLSALEDPRAGGLAGELGGALKKLWAPVLGVSVLAVFVAGYLASGGDGGSRRTVVMTPQPAPAAVAGAAPAAIEPAAPAAAASSVAAAPASELPAEIPADSAWKPRTTQPTIMAKAPEPAVDEVADGSSEPAAAEVAAAEPEIEIEMPAEPSRRANKRARARASKRAKPVVAAVAPAPRASTKIGAKAKPAAKAPAVKETKVVEVAAARPLKMAGEAANSAGTGKLTVTSTPPTLIYVDGRNTGQMTPKTLALPAGNHKITLLSPKDRIAKTISVDIAAGKSAQLAKDFTRK